MKAVYSRSLKFFIDMLTSDFEKPESYSEDLIEAKKQYNLSERKYCILRKPTSQWIRRANELLQANFDHKRVFSCGQSYK